MILIFHLILKRQGKDRSLVALDSSYTAPTRLLHGSCGGRFEPQREQSALGTASHRKPRRGVIGSENSYGYFQKNLN